MELYLPLKEAGSPIESSQQMSFVSSMQEATAYVAAEMEEKELQKAGLQIDEFFVRCTYNGIKCSFNEMKSFTDKRYGNCFMFNWNGSFYVQRHGQNMGKDISLLGTWSLYYGLLVAFQDFMWNCKPTDRSSCLSLNQWECELSFILQCSFQFHTHRALLSPRNLKWTWHFNTQRFSILASPTSHAVQHRRPQNHFSMKDNTVSR